MQHVRRTTDPERYVCHGQAVDRCIEADTGTDYINLVYRYKTNCYNATLSGKKPLFYGCVYTGYAQ